MIPNAPDEKPETQRGRWRILVVDDEEDIRLLLEEILVKDGYDVVSASDGREAIDALESERFDLVMTDLVMPGLNGVDVMEACQRLRPPCPVIMFTGHPSGESLLGLLSPGYAALVTKPFSVSEIRETVASVLEGHEKRASE